MDHDPEIAVWAVCDDDGDDDPTWHLCFEFRWPDRCVFSFIVEEPYLDSVHDWLALARGDDKKHLGLYQGNGEGSISRDDGVFRFVAAPSGSGGDVRAEFEFPADVLDEKLESAIRNASRAGMRFASIPC